MKMKLGEWRKARGFTQPELAKEVNVSVKSISTYENEGFASAKFETVIRLLEVLGISLDQLEIK